MLSWTDISDHKGGVVILATLLLLAQGGVAWYGRKVGVAVGGAKRLQALSSLVGMVALTPWAIVHKENLVGIKSFSCGRLTRLYERPMKDPFSLLFCTRKSGLLKYILFLNDV